jgi:hypothetical protein
MYPNGRELYYEGNNPENFVREMKTKFNFDPSVGKRWAEWHAFRCPAHLLDVIYGDPQYILGS